MSRWEDSKWKRNNNHRNNIWNFSDKEKYEFSDWKGLLKFRQKDLYLQYLGDTYECKDLKNKEKIKPYIGLSRTKDVI